MYTYYGYKNQLLSLVKPVSIHTEHGDQDSNIRRYYLFYRVGSYFFHHPIDVKELEKCPDLPREDIGLLNNSGHGIEDLISVQFIEKVLLLIQTNHYTFQLSS